MQKNSILPVNTKAKMDKATSHRIENINNKFKNITNKFPRQNRMFYHRHLQRTRHRHNSTGVYNNNYSIQKQYGCQTEPNILTLCF